MKEKIIFVIMPFGSRALADGTPHDFDRFYNDVLKTVGQSEGYQVLRVDELVEAGTITDQALRHLYSADIVLADVSAPNSNVYYELGVRQAISSGATILVAVEGTVLPFDIASQRILFYNRQFDADENFHRRYRRVLSSESTSRANPVQAALQELGVAPDLQQNQAAFERELESKIARATRDEQLVAVWHWAKQFPDPPVSGLMTLAERLAKVEDYATAALVLSAAYPAADGDYEVHRQRGFYLRKLGDLDNALIELHRALELNPSDPQTLGMLGGTSKRQGFYAEALEYYKRAVRIAPRSLYLRVAYAGMTILADPENTDSAHGIYGELREYIADSESLVGDYWADLVAGEANFVLGDFARSRTHLADAIKNGAPPADAQSTAEQMRMLGQVGVYPAEAEDLADSLVRAARSGERSVPFLSLSAPSDVESRQHLIFHISDVHFGTIRGKNNIPKDMHRFVDDENSNPLSLELKNEFQQAFAREKCSPEDATVVLSGDLAYTGTPEEFALAKNFLGELCDKVGISRAQVVVVPGNHDIDWKAGKANLSRRFDNYLSFAHDFYGSDLFYQLFPLIKWDFHVGTDRPRSNEIVYIQRRGPVTFVGLNSCVFEDDQHHYGFVGLKQLSKVSELLPEAAGNDIRIAVMHHHLHPYPEALGPARVASDIITDMSTVRDAGIVEQRLSRLGFSMLLHGHKHKPQLRETIVRNRQDNSPYAARPLIVSGCGSTGVAEHELEHNQSNHYAILKLLRGRREQGADFVRIEWRELAVQAGAEWVTAGSWILKG